MRTRPAESGVPSAGADVADASGGAFVLTMFSRASSATARHAKSVRLVASSDARWRESRCLPAVPCGGRASPQADGEAGLPRLTTVGL